MAYAVSSAVIPGLGDKGVRLLLVDLGGGWGGGGMEVRGGSVCEKKRAFLCLKMTPCLPTQPVRQAAGTETGQGPEAPGLG